MGQSVYYLNCPGCSRIMEVVNPRLDDEPLEVRVHVNYNNYFSSYLRSEVHLVLNCPSCGAHLYIILKYKFR
jgi:hypothetical protein